MMKHLFFSIVNLFQYTIILLNKILSFTYSATHSAFRFYSIKMLSTPISIHNSDSEKGQYGSAVKYVLIILLSFICVFASAIPRGAEFLDATGRYYEDLGISENATQNEIKKAYRRLVMKHHPDRGGDSEKFVIAREAYEYLVDPVKRAEYDERMRQRRSASPGEGFSQASPDRQRPSVPPDIHLEEVRWLDVQLKPAEDPYRVLGVGRSAEDRLIKEKYESLTEKIIRDITKEVRKKRKENRGLNQEKISELNRIYSAYRILSHPEWRRQYDFSRDRTINMRGRHLVFIDQANQVRSEFFESINGEVFDLLSNEKGERVLVRGVLFPPPEKQTAIEKFMGTPITMETVIKLSGEKLKFDLVNMETIKEAGEALQLLDQRRRTLEDVVKNLKHRIAQTRQFQENRKVLENLRTQINEKWNSLRSSAQNQARNIFQSRTSSSKALAPSSTELISDETHRSSFEPNRLTWEELYRMTHPNSEHAGSNFSRVVKRMGPETLVFFGALGAFMFLKTGFDSVQYDGVQMDPEFAETLTAQMTSPLGVFSFMCFIMAAGATNMLLEKWMNKHIKMKYNQSKAGINTGIAAQGDVTKEHRKTAGQIDKRNSRFLRLISVSRTAFTLSAGMMVSTAVHEYFANPNNQECWKGMMDKEERSFDFIEICDKAYSEWKAVYKTLAAVPTAMGVYKLVNNKLKLSPLERKIAKGILGVTVALYVSNGFDDFGKFGDWGPDLVTMVAAGYSASMLTNGIRLGWNSQWRQNLGQNIRDKWNQWNRSSSTALQNVGEGRAGAVGLLDSKVNSNQWSKIKSMAGRLTRGFSWPGWLVQGSLSLPHLVAFFGFHELYHPLALKWKNANLSDDIFDQQIQINSYTGRSLNPHDSEEQDFEFWEGNPAEDCALSNPQDMGILEILTETIWNSERKDCPGRYFSHQLNVHSNLLSAWRQNQTFKFATLNQSWQRDQAEARLGYETVTNILFDGISENAGLFSSDEDLRKGWKDIYYHNVQDDVKIRGVIHKEKNDTAQEIIEKIISENEVCKQANRAKILCSLIEEGVTSDLEGIEICESANELIDSCNEIIIAEVSQVEDEINSNYTFDGSSMFDEDADESVSNSREYLRKGFRKFKWAVQQIDQYISTQENKNQFQFNNSVLTSYNDEKYLNFRNLPEEELLGTLRGLFNAVDQRVDISQYYSTGQIDQCNRDENCDEGVLRVRAVSAGVDLLDRIHIFISVAKGMNRGKLRIGSEIKYSNLISEIREIFRSDGEDPQTYTTPSYFNKLNKGKRDMIHQHRQSTEENTGMLSSVVPLMDSFHANSPMQYIVYNMVCGDDLDYISLPSAESAKCSSQGDLEQLAEQLPSFENGGEAFVEKWTQPYTFRIPKLIKGQAPAGLCEKDYREAFETSFTVNGSEYKNLLEFVLDSRNIKTDVKKFWEEKVEKQYILLMGCFETQYKKIYNNHFISTVHSEETERIVKPVSLSSTPPLSASMALGYADVSSVSVEEIEMPKGILKSMMNQADYLLSRFKDLHQYPQSFESVDCSDDLEKEGEMDEKTLKICDRKDAVEFTFERVKKRFGVCSHINMDREYNIQEKANINIECFREMILNLFEHIGDRIKSQQCLTDDISKPRTGIFTLQANDQNIFPWGRQFDYATVTMQELVPPTVNEIMWEHGVSKDQCLKDNWCPLYVLPFRDSASFLVIRNLSSVFDQLVYLHHQVSLFSSHIAVSEECNESYLSDPNSDTLIKQSDAILP